MLEKFVFWNVFLLFCKLASLKPHYSSNWSVAIMWHSSRIFFTSKWKNKILLVVITFAYAYRDKVLLKSLKARESHLCQQQLINVFVLELKKKNWNQNKVEAVYEVMIIVTIVLVFKEFLWMLIRCIYISSQQSSFFLMLNLL